METDGERRRENGRRVRLRSVRGSRRGFRRTPCGDENRTRRRRRFETDRARILRCGSRFVVRKRLGLLDFPETREAFARRFRRFRPLVRRVFGDLRRRRAHPGIDRSRRDRRASRRRQNLDRRPGRTGVFRRDRGRPQNFRDRAGLRNAERLARLVVDRDADRNGVRRLPGFRRLPERALDGRTLVPFDSRRRS